MLVSSRRPRAERKTRVTCAAGERGPAVPQVARKPPGGLLADRHDPLLAALSAHVDRLAFEIDVAERESDRLGAPQPAGVDELDERAIAQRERVVAVQVVDEPFDLCHLRRDRKPSP